MEALIQKLKRFSKGFLYNYKGWHTNRKIVVIESDDWGSERTPTKHSYLKLLESGIRVDKCPFGKFDTLETNKDLDALFSVLSSVKDKEGNFATMTANFNLANPDFAEIKNNDFEKYSYLNYTQILEKYNRNFVLETINEGIANKVFFPQNHSREHLSASIWLDEIRNGNKSLKIAFGLQMYALSRITSPDIVKFHLASQLYRTPEELKFVSHAMDDGFKIFNSIFGFNSDSFIAPVYTWNDDNEAIMANNDVRFIQSSFYQNYFSPFQTDSFTRKFRYTGEKNVHKQIYTVRNCLFEPSLNENFDWIGSCLSDISLSFLMKKPAIISSHRLNYIGSLEEKNREKSLDLLKRLLTDITRKWPDVEFMTSVELGNTIAYEYSQKNIK